MLDRHSQSNDLRSHRFSPGATARLSCPFSSSFTRHAPHSIDAQRFCRIAVFKLTTCIHNGMCCRLRRLLLHSHALHPVACDKHALGGELDGSVAAELRGRGAPRVVRGRARQVGCVRGQAQPMEPPEHQRARAVRPPILWAVRPRAAAATRAPRHHLAPASGPLRQRPPLLRSGDIRKFR